MSKLPAAVIREDRNFEQTASEATTELMKLRWHWTLNENNPDRVPLREYARATGKALSTIQAHANGYALLLGDRAGSVTPVEAVQRANMGAETQAATEAVAEARELTFQHTRQSRPTEVRRVRDIARERAEQRGTSIADEAPKVAQQIVRAEKTEQRVQAARRDKLGLRFVEMEGKLDAAKRKLIEALNLAHAVPWGDEERELLASTLANVKALLGLIDVALAGVADVDWDAELSRITRDVA